MEDRPIIGGIHEDDETGLLGVITSVPNHLHRLRYITNILRGTLPKDRVAFLHCPGVMGSIVVEHIDNISSVLTRQLDNAACTLSRSGHKPSMNSEDTPYNLRCRRGHSYEFVVKPIEGNRFRADITDVTERVK